MQAFAGFSQGSPVVTRATADFINLYPGCGPDVLYCAEWGSDMYDGTNYFDVVNNLDDIVTINTFSDIGTTMVMMESLFNDPGQYRYRMEQLQVRQLV